jgi:hypothetical protein
MKTALISLALAALLAGCTTQTVFQTKTDRSRIPAFDRILVVSRLPVVSNQFLNRFLTAFPKPYAICTVSGDQLSMVNPDSLIPQQAKFCGSQVMLTITPGRDYVSGSADNVQTQRECYLELSDIATGKPFWKAVGHSISDFLARDIVNQLIDDRIITAAFPTELTKN